MVEDVKRQAGLVGCACGKYAMARGKEQAVDGVVHRADRPCYREGESKQVGAIPERAGREGDQALPSVGRQSVFAERRRRLDEREAIGIKRYGRSLETFNGRDALRDLVDELDDAANYATQVRLEHQAVVEALCALGRKVRGELIDEQLVAASLELVGTLEAQKAKGA